MNTKIIHLKAQMTALHKELDAVTATLDAIQQEDKRLIREPVNQMSLCNRIHEARRLLATAEYVV